MPAPPLPPARVVRISDGDLFVRDTGGDDVVPIVLVHGWMASSDLNWFRIFEPLGRHRRTIALDLRQHGRGIASDERFSFDRSADDVAELLDALGIERAVVVGYSLGTAVAQTFASRHRSRCAGIVLCAGALHWRGPLRRVSIWRAGWDGTLQRVSLGRWAGHRLADRLVAEEPQLAPHRDWLVAELERGHPGGLRSAGAALARFDSRGLERHAVPAVVVVMQRDRLCPPRRQRKMGRDLQVTAIEVDTGHLGAVFAGPAVADAILESLRRLGDGSPAELAAAS